jgi:hypothetical protein
MLGKTVIFIFSLAVALLLFVYLIEMFVPLNAKNDFNTICRKYLLKMENTNGITQTDVDSLIAELTSGKFSGIVVNGTTNAKRGDVVSLDVSATYSYDSVTGFFISGEESIAFRYGKETLARRAVN